MKTIMMVMIMMMFINITQLSGFTTLSVSNTILPLGRHLMSTEYNVSEPAAERIDPLDSFNKYKGGYDVTNKHYWSSTVFTGIYGYAMAMIWLLCGLGYGMILIVNAVCCYNRRKLKKRIRICHHMQYSYFWPILSAIFFTGLAIIGCGLVLGGNDKFHSRVKTVIDILIDTADEASETLYNTTGAIKDMITSLEKTNSNETSEASKFLGTTSQRLDSQAYDIQNGADKHRGAIDKGLEIANTITIVIFSLNLVAAICLSVFGVLRLPKIIRLFVAICWALTFFCWLFFGIYFFLEKFAEDTCTALEGFQQDPYNNSLSSILPCDELLSAKSILHEVSQGVSNLVNEVNDNIKKSYGNIVQICNPFSSAPNYDYQADYCPENTIRIGDIPQVLRMLTCPDSKDGTCNGGIPIARNDFDTVVAYTTSIQKIINVFPGMESLIECETVKEAFGEIVENHCEPMKRYVYMEWTSMVSLAVVMVVLVLGWTVEAHREKSRHSLVSGSVKPHYPPEEMLESGIEDANTKD